MPLPRLCVAAGLRVPANAFRYSSPSSARNELYFALLTSVTCSPPSRRQKRRPACIPRCASVYLAAWRVSLVRRTSEIIAIRDLHVVLYSASVLSERRTVELLLSRSWRHRRSQYCTLAYAHRLPFVRLFFFTHAAAMQYITKKKIYIYI